MRVFQSSVSYCGTAYGYPIVSLPGMDECYEHSRKLQQDSRS